MKTQQHLQPPGSGPQALGARCPASYALTGPSHFKNHFLSYSKKSFYYQGHLQKHECQYFNRWGDWERGLVWALRELQV